MSLKTRLAALEAAVPAIKEARIMIFTRAGCCDDEVTGFQYQDLIIKRLPKEVYTEFEARSISWIGGVGYGDIAFMRSIYT